MHDPNDKPPLQVTRPFLPALDEFIPYLEQIWQRRILTNKGPFHQQFERALQDYLGVEHLALFANGTLALVTALQALRVTGEVITTPFSFVATSHALLWNGLEPVFVDIDPLTLNLDPRKIEAAITPWTSAIVPVHCYGNPCDVDAIQAIADRHRLKVIYDAAHAFGVQCQGGSVLRHGDLSALSFHATKVFNTFEGGALICRDAQTKRHVDHLKNFGFVDETTVIAPGINGKMNEFSAALGLLQLEHIDDVLARRRHVDSTYRRLLQDVPGIRCVAPTGQRVANHAYFPILVGPDHPCRRDELYARMRAAHIHARRYFYPLVSDFPMYRGLASAQHHKLPVAHEVASQVICLPMHPELTEDDIERVVEVIRRGPATRTEGGLD
jgi:dTDP-4-amino-4,6-dideoxygalactose transaminase